MHDDGFVPLEAFFRRPARDEREPAPASANAPECESTDPPGETAAVEMSDALAAVRRFHAAIADAVDAAVDDLLRDIACDVLARELALAPADLAAIVAAALERFAADSPLSLRAHPDDIAALDGFEFAAIADPNLRRGDVAIDVRSGTIDAGLGARLECLLEAMRR